MIICNIKGVPLIIQMNIFVETFIGLNLVIAPKETKSPNGIAKTKVIINNKQVVPNPCNRSKVTFVNILTEIFCH